MRWIAVCVIALMLLCAPAHGAALLLARLPSDAPAAEVLAGAHESGFKPILHNGFRPALNDQAYWLRIDVDRAPGAEQRVLSIRRVPLDRVTLYLPEARGYRSFASGWLESSDQAQFSVCCYGFTLPRDMATGPLYLHVQDSSPSIVWLDLLSWSEYARWDRFESVIMALILCTLIGLGAVNALFYGVVRDPAYARLAGFQLFAAVFFGASADLYRFLPHPVLAGMSWMFPWSLFGALASACAMSFVQGFLELSTQRPRVDRALTWSRWLVVAIALVGSFDLGSYNAIAKHAFNAGLDGLMLLTGVAALLMLKTSRRSAVFVLIGWTILLLFAWQQQQTMVTGGPIGALALYGNQAGQALFSVILSIGLADRTMEFRKQRDRAQLLREQAESRLLQEQSRRALTEALQAMILQGGADLPFALVRRTLAALHQVVPLYGCAAYLEHGGERLTVCEPSHLIDRVETFTRRRLTTLRSIAQSGRRLVLSPTDADQRAEDGTPLSAGVVPLPPDRAGWGVLLLARPEWEPFTTEELDAAADFGGLAMKAVSESRRQSSLKQRASFDALTGALNRGNIESLLEQQFEHAVLGRQPFSVLFIDLDHFKRINDTYGHSAGDECLIRVTQRIQHSLRAGQAIGRYGGEEFLVILPGVDATAARPIAEAIRAAVRNRPVEGGGDLNIELTISIGGASRQPGELNPRAALERADQALYAAKNAGRDRVMWSDFTPTQFIGAT